MPSHARLAGAIAISGLVALALSAQLAGQAASPSSGSRQSDASPGSMKLVGQVGGTVRDVAVVGDIAYLAVGPRIWVVSVADASAPRVLGMSEVLPYVVTELHADGDRVVSVGLDLRREATILTVHRQGDSAGLQVLGEAVLDCGQCSQLSISGNLAALLDSSGPRFVDIADPSNPTVYEYPFPRRYSYASYDGLVLVGGFAYLFMSTFTERGVVDPRLEVLDLADPGDPAVVARLDVGGILPTIAGNTLYTVSVAVGGAAIVQVVDVSAPTRPRLMSATRLPDQARDIVALAAANGHVFVLRERGAITVLDGLDPSAPRVVSTFDVSGAVNAATVANGRLFLGLSVPHSAVPADPPIRPGLAALDITNPRELRELGRLAVMPAMVADAVVVDEHLYATAGGDDGALWAFDLADPTMPMPETLLDLPVGSSAIGVDGKLLFVSGEDAGLYVVDVTIGGKPRVRSRAAVARGDGPIVAGNGFVHLGDHARLVSLDVRNPDLPVVLPEGWYMPPVSDLAMVGEWLYLTDFGGGWAAVDLREPEEPRLARHDLVGSDTFQIAANNNHVVIAREADFVQDLLVIDVATMTERPPAERIALPGGVAALAVAGDTGIVGTVDRRLWLFDVYDTRQELREVQWLLPDADHGSEPYFQSLRVNDELLVAATSGSGIALLRWDSPVAPQPTPSSSPVPAGHRVYLPATFADEGLRRSVGSLEQVAEWPEPVLAVANMGNRLAAYLAVLDLSDPAEPRTIGRSVDLVDEQTTADGPPRAALAVAGGLAYLSFGSGDLWVMDVTAPAQPRLVTRVPITDHWSAWSGIELAGSRAILFGNSGVRMFDLVDPRKPRQLAPVPPLDVPSTGYVTDVEVIGNTLLLTRILQQDTDPGLIAVDISDPSQPRRIGEAFAGHSAAAVVSDGRLAYVAPSFRMRSEAPLSGGIIVLDVRDPARMREVGHRLDGRVYELTCLALPEPGTLLAAGDWVTLLWDVTQPTLPRQLAMTRVAGSCLLGSALAVDGQHAHVVVREDEGRPYSLRTLRWSVGPR
jgi:hypothetical protein